MGECMTVDELKAMLMDKELMKELPLSKEMIDQMVATIKAEAVKS